MNDEHNQLQMGHVQYENTAPGSIFGSGEDITKNFFVETPAYGDWINLGAGDGRYAQEFLSTCNTLTALDNDPRALNKLKKDLSVPNQNKLKTVEADLIKPLEFKDNKFDGAFSTATIHIFDEKTIKTIISEMFRIVKPGGKVVIDFLFDIRREMDNGELYIYPGEISYSLIDAKRLINSSFKGHSFKLEEDKVKHNFQTNNGVAKYHFNSGIFLVQGVK